MGGRGWIKDGLWVDEGALGVQEEDEGGLWVDEVECGWMRVE